MSDTFDNLIFAFDLQFFSEKLRKKLPKINFIKPNISFSSITLEQASELMNYSEKYEVEVL
ncbi:MAG: hypothetical protein AABZ74_06455 [Cyanobacteriota bacterium]